MKNRFDQFLRSPAASVRSVLLYGASDNYLDFCVESICAMYKTTRESVVVQRYTQSSLLEQPQLLRNQGDLFSPMAGLKIVIVTGATDRSMKLVDEVLEKNPSVFLIFPCLVGSVRKLKVFHETSKIATLAGCYLGIHPSAYILPLV